MRGILIDPWLEDIAEVECEKGIEAIYKLLSNRLGPKVNCFCSGMNWPNGDVLYVDDEGFLKPGMMVFRIDRFDGQPLAGNGLILGHNRQGESIDAKSSLDSIKQKVTWPRLVTA